MGTHIASTANVSGSARVSGEGRVASNDDIAWVDRVGSGESMTLHRIVDGWRVNAGCVSFEAPTVNEVLVQVLANTDAEVAEPNRWSFATREMRERWATQVQAACVYLASMVKDGDR